MTIYLWHNSSWSSIKLNCRTLYLIFNNELSAEESSNLTNILNHGHIDFSNYKYCCQELIKTVKSVHIILNYLFNRTLVLFLPSYLSWGPLRSTINKAPKISWVLKKFLNFLLLLQFYWKHKMGIVVVEFFFPFYLGSQSFHIPFPVRKYVL